MFCVTFRLDRTAPTTNSFNLLRRKNVNIKCGPCRVIRNVTFLDKTFKKSWTSDFLTGYFFYTNKNKILHTLLAVVFFCIPLFPNTILI